MVWRTGDGEIVVDRFQSHLHIGVVALLPEALKKVRANKRQFLVEEVDMGRVVGQTVCVITTGADNIIFAQRAGRRGKTRFVIGRNPESCRSVVVILKSRREGDYVLMTAYIGKRAEPEPWDEHATPASLVFWQTHALVWGSEETILGTETNRCPW